MARKLSIWPVVMVAGSLALAGCSFDGKEAVMPAVTDAGLQALPETASTRPIEFHQIVADLKTGQHVGAVRWDIGCMQSTNITWTDEFADGLEDRYEESFNREMQEANVTLVADTGEASQDESDKEPLRIQVAGRIADVKMNACAGIYNINWDIDTYFQMKWQLYDMGQKQMVYEVVTEGRHKKDNADGKQMDTAVIRAFEMSVRNLIADPGFRKIVSNGS